MNPTLLFLIIFFVGAIIFQKIFKKNFCAMCVSVTLTWLTLLVFYFPAKIDALILGILMGGSAVGLVYYLFRSNGSFQIFKFPFLISLFWLIYIFLGDSQGWIKDFVIVAGVWILFITIFVFNKNEYLRDWGQKIIECCKNW